MAQAPSRRPSQVGTSLSRSNNVDREPLSCRSVVSPQMPPSAPSILTLFPIPIVPKNWNDKILLEQTLFKHLSTLKQKSGANFVIPPTILRNLERCSRSCKTVEVWLRHAFSPLKPQADPENIQIFVDFYMKLSKSYNGAIQFLNSERMKLKLCEFETPHGQGSTLARPAVPESSRGRMYYRKARIYNEAVGSASGSQAAMDNSVRLPAAPPNGDLRRHNGMTISNISEAEVRPTKRTEAPFKGQTKTPAGTLSVSTSVKRGAPPCSPTSASKFQRTSNAKVVTNAGAAHLSMKQEGSSSGLGAGDMAKVSRSANGSQPAPRRSQRKAGFPNSSEKLFHPKEEFVELSLSSATGNGPDGRPCSLTTEPHFGPGGEVGEQQPNLGKKGRKKAKKSKKFKKKTEINPSKPTGEPIKQEIACDALHSETIQTNDVASREGVQSFRRLRSHGLCNTAPILPSQEAVDRRPKKRRRVDKNATSSIINIKDEPLEPPAPIVQKEVEILINHIPEPGPFQTLETASVADAGTIPKAGKGKGGKKRKKDVLSQSQGAQQESVQLDVAFTPPQPIVDDHPVVANVQPDVYSVLSPIPDYQSPVNYQVEPEPEAGGNTLFRVLKNSSDRTPPPNIDVHIKEEFFDRSPAAMSLSHADVEPIAQELYSMTLMEPEDDKAISVALNANIYDPDLSTPRLARFPKPTLPELPPIWAESRQEVCEAFDWFRSYQGGVYHVDNAAKGYLLSAFASSRDIFEHNGKLIVSHGGGKAESIHCQNGLLGSYQASDQLADDKSVRALLDNYRSHRPLALVIDDKYALFPYDLASRGVTYVVLGFYMITYAWAEYQPANTDAGRVLRYKFAFRWCEEQGTPWWDTSSTCDPSQPRFSESPTGTSVNQNPDIPTKTVETDLFSERFLNSPTSVSWNDCAVCGRRSREVYSVWVCLTPDCDVFWRNKEGKELSPDVLNYSPDFLALQPPDPMPIALSLLSDCLSTSTTNGTSTGYAFTRGVHCPQCGRLSCRFEWENLKCINCKWVQQVDVAIRSANDLWCGRLPVTFEYFFVSSLSDINYGPSRSFRCQGGKGTIQTFNFPIGRGRIHHIRTCNPSGMRQADEVFTDYQEQARSGQLRFRRWPMRAHKCRGTLLTNYFSHNAGEPYQYVGGDANTVTFEKAPAVVKARNLIQKRIDEALGISAEFNEVLSCAYMERQRMAFHSDAEVGLGPLVAGLSLGSPALMHFRLHPKHDPLWAQRGILLTIVLRHGDVLVMDGAGVQEYYEHTVVPNNFRIAATARQIGPSHHLGVKTEQPV